MKKKLFCFFTISAIFFSCQNRNIPEIIFQKRAEKYGISNYVNTITTARIPIDTNAVIISFLSPKAIRFKERNKFNQYVFLDKIHTYTFGIEVAHLPQDEFEEQVLMDAYTKKYAPSEENGYIIIDKEITFEDTSIIQNVDFIRFSNQPVDKKDMKNNKAEYGKYYSVLTNEKRYTFEYLAQTNAFDFYVIKKELDAIKNSISIKIE